MTKSLNTTLDSKTLINAFREDENKAFKLIYSTYRSQFIEQTMKQHSGINQDHIIDIFQDALIVLYHNVITGKITDLKNPYAYLYRIGQNLIFAKLRKAKKEKQIRNVLKDKFTQELDFFPINILDDEERKNNLNNVFPKLGKKCQALLVSYYYKGLSFNEIADKLGYSSANTVKSQKHKCIKQLRKFMNGEK